MTDPAAQRGVLAAAIIASSMAYIDGSIIGIALPVLQGDLDASFGAAQWTISAYALATGGLLLVGGGAGDRFGRRSVFIAGLGLFASASILCALAPTIGALIAARALQGVGAALMIPQSLALITDVYDSGARGRAIGLWAGASAAMTAFGPPLGGVLIETAGWPAMFWINPPLCALAAWLALRHAPNRRAEKASGPLDWPGAACAILGCGGLAGALTLAGEQLAIDGLVIGLFALGVAGFFAFWRVERGAPAPLAPPVVFQDRAFVGLNLVTALIYGAFTAALFLMPFDLLVRRELSPWEVGLTLTPLGLIIGALSRPAGAWADRAGPRPPLIFGCAVAALGMAGLALDAPSYWLGAVLPLAVLASGIAFVAAPLSTAVMAAAPADAAGIASGDNNTASRIAGHAAVVIV
ncbi:MAG: MFS transporter, partial [Pseudomonadota bacterium]